MQTEVKAQQVKYEELMEKLQRLDRKIKNNDKNSSLERKVKQLEEERHLDQNFQRWEKKGEELKEDNRQPKREQMKARLKRLISANRKGEKEKWEL